MGKKKNNSGQKKKVAVVFDESKRRDFICGFRKRKEERRKTAKEQIQRMLKEEKKRIKQENKESYKKLVLSSKPIPHLEKLLQEEYEDDDVNVKIVELSSETLQQNDIIIGANKPREEEVKKEVKAPKSDNLVITGMGSDEESEEDEATSDNETQEPLHLKTKNDIKRHIKHQATKKMQKSKVFQMKSKLDRIQNKKSSNKTKHNKEKMKLKSKKKDKGNKKKSFGRKKN